MTLRSCKQLAPEIQKIRNTIYIRFEIPRNNTIAVNIDSIIARTCLILVHRTFLTALSLAAKILSSAF